MEPSAISLKSMLPPQKPESPVPGGALPGPTAVATQPSMGWSGTVAAGGRCLRAWRCGGSALADVPRPLDGFAYVLHLRAALTTAPRLRRSAVDGVCDWT